MQTRAAEPEDSLQWQVHLARRQPGRAAAVLVVVLLAAGWAGFAFRHPLPGIAALGLLFGAVAEFLFPVTYRLDARGAEARAPFLWRKIAWGEVKRVYAADDAIKLSPLSRSGRREAFRGVLLRLDGNGDAVRAAIERFRGGGS